MMDSKAGNSLRGVWPVGHLPVVHRKKILLMYLIDNQCLDKVFWYLPAENIIMVAHILNFNTSWLHFQALRVHEVTENAQTNSPIDFRTTKHQPQGSGGSPSQDCTKQSVLPGMWKPRLDPSVLFVSPHTFCSGCSRGLCRGQQSWLWREGVSRAWEQHSEL